MRKDVLSVTIDAETARVLADLAGRECEGNRSQFFRRAIREAGERRGLWPVADQGKAVRVERTQTA
jgi:hypothetical protein